MKVLDEATTDELTLIWLKSEWWRLGIRQDRRLIDDPDPTSAVENATRRDLLRSYRSVILDTIPQTSRYTYARVELADLARLYIVPVFDWFLDTGSSFRLVDTLTHLQDGRGANIPGALQGPINHSQDVMQKLPFLQGYDAEATDEHLVLLASHPDGPYTIIDGTHRAVALLLNNQKASTLPWRAILILSPDMNSSRWHVGFPMFEAIKQDLKRYVADGRLW